MCIYTLMMSINRVTVDDLPVYIISDEYHSQECLMSRQLYESADIVFVKYKDKLGRYNNYKFPLAF